MGSVSEVLILTSKYIEDNLKALTGVDEVANNLSLSSTYINRLFKRYLGASCVDYLKMRKISEGIKSGVEGRGNIIDIAFEYGFNSHEVFSRNCRRYFKHSPRELLKLKGWKGYPSLSSSAIWYLTNLKYIDVKKVRLPRLELSKSDRGAFTLYLENRIFKGDKTLLDWDPSKTYKLLPSGIYEQYTIPLNREYDSLRAYLLEISQNYIIEYKKGDSILFYRAKF